MTTHAPEPLDQLEELLALFRLMHDTKRMLFERVLLSSYADNPEPFALDAADPAVLVEPITIQP